MELLLICFTFWAAVTCCEAVGPRPEEFDSNFWRKNAQDAVKAAVNSKRNYNVAKNVIMFLGDGMGIPTITLGRIFKGQKQGMAGEEASLSWDSFRDVAQLKTYAVDKQVTDSAAAATSYLGGVKGNMFTVGVNAKVKHHDCDAVAGNEVNSIIDWTQEAGKSTGFISTAKVTHASPAALYAHSPDRSYESDETIPEDDKSKCKDIARQLVEDSPGKNVKVIFGGGRQHFFPAGTFDEVTKQENLRVDGRNIVDDWKADKVKRGASHAYLTTTKDLRNVDVKNTEFLLGLFGHGYMDYELDRVKDENGTPSIAEMTAAAIKRLSQDPNGYFLFVEGAKIDIAHHDSLGVHALEEIYEMDKAVETALGMTNPEETLILVTADHDHGVKFTGDQQPRGTDVRGIADLSWYDNLPYTVMIYSSGPGYAEDMDAKRKAMLNGTFDKDYKYISPFPRNITAHGGEDIQAFAYGPMSHLFQGVQEQNYVAHAMAYASCVGQNKDHCSASSGTSHKLFGSYTIIMLLWSLKYVL